MLSNEEGIGKINTSAEEKINLAELSKKFVCNECGYFLKKYPYFEKEEIIVEKKCVELNQNVKNVKNQNDDIKLKKEIEDKNEIREKKIIRGENLIKEKNIKNIMEENFELIKVLKKKKKKKKYSLYDFKNIKDVRKEILEYSIVSERIDIQTKSNKEKMENIKVYLKKIKLLDIFDFLINILKIFFIFYVVYRILELQFNFSHFEYK